MMAEFEGLRRRRVLPPLASLPGGEQGGRPPEVRPSPPPIGWATGSIAPPGTGGGRPGRRLRPALPRVMFMWSALPTVPIVARQAAGIRRTSPEGSVIWAQVPSRAVSVAETPAERQSLPPPPGCISRLWTDSPVGIFDSGRQLPTFGSAGGPLLTAIPAFRAPGGGVYFFNPPGWTINAVPAQ